jgi:glycosyltransferase involved in cell wall biosynthesis
VWSLPFPFYDGYRFGLPAIPDAVTDVDLVHAHTPFSLGLAGYRLARRADLPLVVSYHTPTSEYANYLAPDSLASGIASISTRYERWFLERADLVLAPSGATAAAIETDLLDSIPVLEHPNGVNVRQFQPTDATAFAERYDIPTDRPLVGYTGRHGYEKNLEAIVDAVADLDVTLVFGGEGPATTALEERAADRGVDTRFLGFLDRGDLPAFYSALDVFAFPSPVETQGIVALEANACGTPVVAVDEGALAETVVEGETGYHFEHGDIEDFAATIERALDENASLRETCLATRDAISLEKSLEGLERAYETVLNGT